MSTPIDVSDHPAGSVNEPGRYLLDLTGPHSHVLNRKLGWGSLIIGPAGMGKKAELHVGADEKIDWSVFDPFSTGAGAPWPRFFAYYGNDSDFLVWARQRKIEQFSWAPAFSDRRAIDAGEAQIHELHIWLQNLSGRLDLVPPQACSLSLAGDLSRFTATGEAPRSLGLTPKLSRRHRDAPYVLPELGPLHETPRLSLDSHPLGQSISLKGIERFSQLESLSLHGGFTDWGELAKLPRLKALEVRFTPDLTGLPPLETWPDLDRFIAFHVEETAGKRLKAQMNARAKVRAWEGYAAISKLRKPEWWQDEYGRPFAGWSGRMAKVANAAYDAALGALEKAGDGEAVKAAIAAFADHFNGMKGIETTEREDIGEAVRRLSQLACVAALGVTEEQAQHWFDETRDY